MSSTVISHNTMELGQQFFSWQELVQLMENAKGQPRREADPAELSNLLNASVKKDPARAAGMHFSASGVSPRKKEANFFEKSPKEQVLDGVVREFLSDYAKSKFPASAEKQNQALQEWLGSEKIMARVRSLKPVRQVAAQYAQDPEMSRTILSGGNIPEAKFMRDLKLAAVEAPQKAAPEKNPPAKEKDVPVAEINKGGPSMMM